jgi:hypothetical protein
MIFSFIISLSVLLCCLDISRSNSDDNLNCLDLKGNCKARINMFYQFERHILELIDLSAVLPLAETILLNSGRYSVHPMLNRSRSSRSGVPSFAAVNRLKVRSLIQSLSESHVLRRGKKDSRLFFLKTHKTGSSTQSSIIWRAFCLSDSSRRVKRNCFLPPLESPGRMWSSGDLSDIVSSSGTSNNLMPFDVWNSHVKVSYISYLTKSRSSLNDSFLDSEDQPSAFSQQFFQKVLPNPSYFVSILRRPADRFESAYHWYELYRVEEKSVAKDLSGPSSLLSSFYSSVVPSLYKRSAKLKNRLNPSKVTYCIQDNETPSNCSRHKSVSPRVYIEFIEDIAFKILSAISSFNLSNATPIDYKKIIDDVLYQYEQIFKFRSGFQTLSKELLGVDQFSNGNQHLFESYYHSFLYHYLISNSSQVLLLNLDSFHESLLLFQTALSIPHRFYLYYFKQKTQSYLKIRDFPEVSTEMVHVYSSFTDLIQYYDLILYEVQKEKLSLFEEANPLFHERLSMFNKEIKLFQDQCHPFLVTFLNFTESLRKVVIEQSVVVFRYVSERIRKESDYAILNLLSSEDRKYLCYVYFSDNVDFVKYFHSVK